MHSELDQAGVPDPRVARKDDHVDLALAQRDTPQRNEFDDLEFVHHALAGVDADRVTLETPIAGTAWTWAAPLYINGMTGGTERTTQLNRELAIAARETGLPMACGSVSIGLDSAEAARGFGAIRAENPHGFVMANVGVGRPADDARRAVELLEANALQVHINAVQETVMPEGSRDFSSWLVSVEELVKASPVPVIVKEVGFGLSARTLRQLAGLGVAVADVSGRGGTDFLRIENARRDADDYTMMRGFGQSALACLLDAPADGPTLLASGGVRNPFDVVKALAAGASAVGVAGEFLAVVNAGGSAALIDLIESWLHRIRAVSALLGATSPRALQTTDLILRRDLREFCDLRGVDVASLAHRSDTAG